MKNINLIFFTFLLLVIGCGNSNPSKPTSETPYTKVSGVIATDTTWDVAHSPYIVTSNVIVERNVTLIIEPRVEVRFDGFYGLIVRGVLIADGISNDQGIHFTSNSSQPDMEDWKGLYFDNTNDDASKLKYAKIEYAKTAIDVFSSSPHITDCTITRNYNGIHVDGMLSTIANNAITDNNTYGIFAKGKLKGSIAENIIMRNENGIVSYGPIVLRHNNLENLMYNIVCKFSPRIRASAKIDARHNWWGTTDVEGIKSQIHVDHDDPKLNSVLYSPFATSEIETAGPR